jgi:hypothetical protein
MGGHHHEGAYGPELPQGETQIGMTSVCNGLTRGPAEANERNDHRDQEPRGQKDTFPLVVSASGFCFLPSAF